MSNERAYQRFLAVLNLARRPGTPEEGEAALNMARKMAEKYGFDLNDQSVADPAEQKKAHEVVRKWKQYQGSKKKDMLCVFKIAALVGYTVNGDKVYVTADELAALCSALTLYRKGKTSARNYYKNRLGGSKGFADCWDYTFRLFVANKFTQSVNQYEDKCYLEMLKVQRHLRANKGS